MVSNRRVLMRRLVGPAAAATLLLGALAGCTGPDDGALPAPTGGVDGTSPTGAGDGASPAAGATSGEPAPGTPCDEGSHPDCSDATGSEGDSFRIIAGYADCVASYGADEAYGLCADLDGDDHAGYADAG